MSDHAEARAVSVLTESGAKLKQGLPFSEIRLCGVFRFLLSNFKYKQTLCSIANYRDIGICEIDRFWLDATW